MAKKTVKPHVYRSGKPASTKPVPNDKQQNHPIRKTTINYRQLIEGKWFKYLLMVLFVAYVLYQTILTNRPVMLKLSDQALFLTDLTYLKDCLYVVGGLSVYIASFFNEFFLYPWVGTLIYTAFLLLVAVFTSKVFNLKGWLYPLALIPSLLLLLSVTQNGYMIYLIKLKAFTYVGVLGILIALTGALLGSTSRKPIAQSLVAVLFALVAYPIAGVYGLLGTFLIAVFSIKHLIGEKKYTHLIPAIVALLALWLVPRGYDQWVYQATHQQALYLSNLPDYWSTESERVLCLPYQLGAICLFLFALLPKKMPTSKGVFTVLPIALLLVTILFVEKKTYKDPVFKTELNMMEASEKNDWNRVLELAKELKEEPTRLVVMYTDMALFKLDKLGDAKYQYPEGNKARNDPRNILDVYMAGPFLYFNYGKMNYCYRWCMENTVEYGQSVTSLKYFVLCSAVNGQKNLARKYNNLLAKSLLHRSLSKKLATIIEDPTILDKDPNYKNILTLTHFDDYLDSDQSNIEHYLRFNFAFTVGGPPEMVELCMLANMDLKNPAQFWPAYFAYTERYNKPLPVHIQEAALLFNHIQKTNYIDTRRFSPDVLARFDQFLSMVQQYAGMPDYSASKLFIAQFGDTYWYYYSFFNNQPTPASSSKFSPYSS